MVESVDGNIKNVWILSGVLLLKCLLEQAVDFDTIKEDVLTELFPFLTKHHIYHQLSIIVFISFLQNGLTQYIQFVDASTSSYKHNLY